MTKVFLYLYPIKEFVSPFVPRVSSNHDKLNDYEIGKIFEVLNDVIDKRYRKKGYKVVFVLYPDKNIYGVELKSNDIVIKTDITFNDVKSNYKYPNEKYLIQQIGTVDELVVAGYHVMDCVKRVAKIALASGIDTLVDIDLTDLFFNLYKRKEYFNEEIYDSERFKTYMINMMGNEDKELMERIFNRNYASPVYGFNIKNDVKSNSK